jgi:hypothetical protein
VRETSRELSGLRSDLTPAKKIQSGFKINRDKTESAVRVTKQGGTRFLFIPVTSTKRFDQSRSERKKMGSKSVKDLLISSSCAKHLPCGLDVKKDQIANL